MRRARRPTLVTTPDRSGLVLDHAHAQLGTFISAVDLAASGIWEIRSEHFPDDPDWNFDYSCSFTVVKHAGQRQRIMLDGPAPAHAGRRAVLCRVESSELWMSATHIRKVMHETKATTTRLERIDRPDESFVRAFTEGFDMTEADAAAYRVALLGSTPPVDVRTAHLLLRTSTSVVATASIHTVDDTAFIYNLATVPTARRQGHGREMIRAAIATATIDGGAEIWLQCEPDSCAEKLYSDNGFTTAFRATYIRTLRPTSRRRWQVSSHSHQRA